VNAYGRPHVEAPASGRDLHFNLSHADGLVALAVAGEREIGVDVENVTRGLDLDRLAPYAFAAAEADAFAQAAETEKRSVFFAFWTLKEAYIKARGMGLSLGLDGFAFGIDAAEPAVAFSDKCPDDPARWRFWRFSPTPRHALALAASASVTEVRVIWTTLEAEAEPA
jgi:4'-phosphopantetheinyl transferase